MTKKESFNAILSYVADNEELTAFVKHEIELLERKNSSPRKPTKVQIENENLKAEIITAMTVLDRPVTIKELVAACPAIADCTNQKITHLLIALRNDNVISREYIKKVPYYCIGGEEA